MRFLDTNVFVRYLTDDDPVKSPACFALFERLHSEEEQATTCEGVVAEVVFVLSSRTLYRQTREEVQAKLSSLLVLRGLKLPQRTLYLRALDIYVAYPRFDFEDALCVAHMERSGIEEIVSYDRDFDRFPAISRVEPPPVGTVNGPPAAT